MAMKKHIVDMVNNQIMQKEYMNQLQKLELSVLRDKHTEQVMTDILGEFRDDDSPTPNFKYEKFNKIIKKINIKSKRRMGTRFNINEQQ